MGAIFISYRRADSEGQAGRLFKDLCEHFGKAAVLFDVVGMPKGMDFRQTIEHRLGASGVLLAVIGKTWVTVTDDGGRRRLDDPRDLVRLEIASALRKGIPVIPVLVSGARMPDEKDLPADLKDLVFRDGVELTHARWDADVRLLIEALVPLVPEAKGLGHWLRQNAGLTAAGVLAVCGLAGAGVYVASRAPVDTAQPAESKPQPRPEPPKPQASVASQPEQSPSSAARPDTAPSQAAAPTSAPASSAKPPGDKASSVRATSLAMKRGEAAKLDDIVRWMASVKELKLEALVATGHTDNTLSDAVSQRVSMQRALVVKNYLVARGVPADKVFIESKGSRQPAADNTTAAGRAANNRAAVEVVGKGLSPSGKTEARKFATEIRFE